MSLCKPKHELPWATLFCLDGDSSSDDIWEDLGTYSTDFTVSCWTPARLLLLEVGCSPRELFRIVCLGQ